MRKFLTLCLALAGLGVSGAVVAQTIGGISNGYIEEGDLYRPGNIIKTIVMSNRGQDEVACRKACDADSNCMAFGYVQTTAKEKPTCYLRMIALPRQARRNHGFTKVVSGTKLAYLRDLQKIKPYPGRTIQGGVELRKFPVANQDPIACSDACYRDGSCTGYTYKPRTPLAKPVSAMCTMYSKNGTLTASTKVGYLSGSKGPISAAAKINLPPRSLTPPRVKPAIRR